uniref:Uncharacterized protein n=1 Tax=Periophthalmus magnuspinnatus TaxID=409849 RepID=A0A3B3Z7T0_9GOBI
VKVHRLSCQGKKDLVRKECGRKNIVECIHGYSFMNNNITDYSQVNMKHNNTSSTPKVRLLGQILQK